MSSFSNAARLALLASLLTYSYGCGGADQKGSGSTESANTSSAGGAVTVSRAELAAILQGDFYDPAKTDELIADCMSKNGFAWFSDTEEVKPSELSDKAMANTNGYGITLSPDDGDSAVYTDPNLEYFDGLSKAAQDAYNVALVGNPAGVAPIAEDSCMGLEQAALNVVDSKITSQFVTEVLEEYSTRFEDDPGVQAARAKWVTCMADAGYPYANRDEIIAEITEKYEQPLSEPQLEDLRQLERKLAGIDYDCSADEQEASRNASERITVELLDTYTPA